MLKAGSMYKQFPLTCKSLAQTVYWCVPPAVVFTLRSAHTVYICVLCGSQNKQRLYPYTALTDRFL